MSTGAPRFWTVAEPLEDIGERHQQLLQAAEDVANLPNADWEPDMKTGWRGARGMVRSDQTLSR